MSTADLDTLSLDDLLWHGRGEAPYGWQADMARRLGAASRQTVHDWLSAGRIPPVWVPAVCELIGASAEVRAELERRAGFRMLPLPAVSDAA